MNMKHFALTLVAHYIIPYVLLHSFDVININLQCRKQPTKPHRMSRYVQTFDWYWKYSSEMDNNLIPSTSFSETAILSALF